jgi:hypothetical protein
MKKRILLIAILLIGTSCQKNASTDSTTKSTSTSTNAVVKDAVPFRVVESTYAVSNKFGDVFVKWAAVIENPNLELYGVFPAVTITARDESGAVIGTDDLVLGELPPGLKISCSGQLSATAVPATVEIKPSKVEWKPTKTRADDYRVFGIEKSRMTSSGKDIFQVTGDVTNPYDKEIDSLRVVILLRDSEGKLIGGDTTYVDALPASGSRPFEVKYISVKGKPVVNEIFVYPHGLATWNSLATPK